MKKFLSILLTVVCVVSIFSGCSKKKNDDKVIAVVEGVNVYASEALFYFYDMQAQYEGQFGPTALWNKYEDGRTLGDVLKEEALNMAIMMNLESYIAKEQGFKLTDEELATQRNNGKQYFESLPAEAIEKYGFTLEGVQNIFINFTLRMKLKDNVVANLEYDPAKIEEGLAQLALDDALYGSIKKYGAEGSAIKVRARHILIKTVDDNRQPLPQEEIEAAKEKALEVLEKAKAGEDFEKLVTEYSQDPGSLSTGGEYTFSRGNMVASFEEAAYSMEPGQISDLVESDYGYHIIKLEEKDIPPTEEEIQQRKDYEQAALDYVKSNMSSDLFAEKEEEWKNQYKIEIKNDVWDAIVVDGQSGTTAPGTTPSAEPEATEGAAE